MDFWIYANTVTQSRMNLNNEKYLIYLSLGITVLIILVLFFMPTLWHNDTLQSPSHVPIQNGEVYKEADLHDSHGGHH